MNRKRENQIQSPVFIDCRHFDGSGIGTYMGNLLRQYDRLRPAAPIEVLAKDEHINEIKALSRFKIHRYNDPIYSIREQINWIFKVDPFGLLHVPHYNAPIAFPGQLITTVHDVCHVAMAQFFPGILKRLYSRNFLQMVLQKSDYIVTVSHFSKSEIIKYFGTPEEKIRVIHNGVDPMFRPIDPEEANQVLIRHHLPKEFLLFIGNVKPHKNISGLIQAYRSACEQDPDLPPLVILGQYKNLMTSVAGLSEQVKDYRIKDKIIFTGYLPTEDLPAIYSQAMLFLFPSFYEGFGLPTIEAMACGTPVITSNCTSIPEVVGDAALLVDPYNQDAMADAILNLAGDQQAQTVMRDKGLEHVKAYSWESSALEHLDLYETAQAHRRKKISRHRVPSQALAQQGKRNILFLDQYGDRVGGGQVILLDILGKFRKSDLWNLYVSVPSPGRFTHKLDEAHFPYWCIPTWQPDPNRKALGELSRYLISSVKSTYLIGKKVREHNIEVIYCNGGRTFLAGSLLSIILPVKVFWHLHLILDRQQKRVVTFFGKAPSIKTIISVSNTLESQYEKDKIYPKVHTVNNWVSPQLFELQRPIRSENFVLPMVVGVLGLISKAKGQWTILKSFEQWEKPLPLKLMIYGDPLGTESVGWEDLKQSIERLNQKGWDIQYAGFEQDTLSIYDQLDVLIIPSIVPEAFGLTAIEAMAREVIVIANRSGALVEIIDPERNGFLYDANQYQQLPTILQRLSTGDFDLNKIRVSGLETIKTHYQPEIQLAKLHNLVLSEVKAEH